MIGVALGVAVIGVWLAVAAVRASRSGGSDDASEPLTEFAAHALELDSVDQILEAAAVTARRVFGAARAVSFVHGVDEGAWDARVAGATELESVPAAMRGLFGWFKHNSAIAVRADLGEARFGAMRAPLRQIMDRYGVDVVMPLVHRGEMLAALGVSLGRNPSVWDRAQIKKLRLQATAASANVRLHREASHVISLAREVDLASAAQKALVPDELDGAAGSVSWAGHFQSVGQAGSDFWSVYPLGSRVLIIIGDATGVGLAGSMVSAVVKSCCDAIVDAHGAHVDPASLLGTLNRALWRPEKPAYMTGFAALYDPAEGIVKYANAGHCFPYHLSATGRLGVLHGSGPVLGDELQSRYPIHEQAVTGGDTLVFFTDGMVSGRNPAGTSFGERRLQKLLAGGGVRSASPLRDRIVAEVDRFREGRPRGDDEALIVVHFAGHGS